MTIMTKHEFKFNGPVSNSIIGSSVVINKNPSADPAQNTENEFHLLFDLIDKAHRITERNSSQIKLEDLHNDDFAHWLRDRGYYVSDQTRSGRSKISVGEVDLMIRKENGTPVSIIESFRLQSFDAQNTNIAKHINKLFQDYDTGGLKFNYILIYSESSMFIESWSKYLEYMSALNFKPNFITPHKLISFSDISQVYSKVSDIKIGRAIHQREGEEVVCFHVFINMYK